MPERIQQALPYSEQAANIVRAAILSGRYSPGHRLNEVELSSDLGISRSPLREGLRTLAKEGLVTPVTGQGTFVTKVTLQEIKELLELRFALDLMATQLAAERATPKDLEHLKQSVEILRSSHQSVDGETVNPPPDFHLQLFEAARNSKLSEHGKIVHAQLRLVRFRSASSDERLKDATREHRAIVEAIGARDAQVARDLMAVHVITSATHILELADGDASDLSWSTFLGGAVTAT